MKKHLFYFVLVLSLVLVYNSSNARQWQYIDASDTETTTVSLVSSSQKSSIINYSFNAYNLETLYIDGKKQYIAHVSEGISMLLEGSPDLPLVTNSLIVSDEDKMEIRVLKSDFILLKDIEIAPSKGNLLRNIDPSTVPYKYGKVYHENAFFPENIATMRDPYILRDVRGQTVVISPFQYNPVTKELRIYTNLEVEVYTKGEKGTLNVNKRNSVVSSLAKDFKTVYEDHFLNFANSKYTSLDDKPGNMLIICYGSFMNTMDDYVAWKKQKGIYTEIVDVATIGSSASQIKTYVTNYYNTNGLTYLLLVGDNAQVPASSTSAGASDNDYGFILGNDHYQELFVGRFSAENTTQLATQVERTIYYERDMPTSATWLDNGVGIASNEGSSPSDEEHMDAIETELENYGYSIDKCYQDGGSASQLTTMLNSGRGIINYVGHGSNTCFTSMYYCSSDVDALTNDNKLPFIFDVACVNGNFTSMTCFGETWLRATNNGQPTGAIAIIASTINQHWVPPMTAQNEMNDILVGNISGSIKRSFGGLTVNGMFKMNDSHGTDGYEMTDTWTCFGDPSLTIRTKTPSAMTVTHDGSINSGASSFAVNCNLEDALVGLTVNGEIVGRGYVSGGSANITVSGLASSGTMKVTVTGYNKVPYTANVSIGGGTTLPIAAFSGCGSIQKGGSVTFTNQSQNATSYSWSFPGGNPSSSTATNPTVTYNTTGNYNVTLIATSTEGNDTEISSGCIVVSENTYCASSGTTQTYEWVSGVQIGTFSKTSGASPYSDFTSENIDVEANSTVNVTLTPQFASSTYNEYWKVYIDYNGDADFDDSGEEAFSGSGSSNVSGTITIPSGLNLSTRLRVIMAYSQIPDACSSFQYGEVEDYTITIGEQVVLAPVTNFSGLPTTINVGETVTFTDLSTNNPTAWSWSFAGGSPSSSTIANPTVTYNTEGTYNVSLTVSNSAGNNTKTINSYVTVNVLDPTYCTSESNDFSYEWIAGVSVGSFTKNSGTSAYTDYFDTETIEVNEGNNSITLTPGFKSSSYTEYWKVWIDYNVDGDFEDSGEEVYSGSSSSSVTGTITIPASFTQITRMRVAMRYGSVPPYCGSFDYGEVEDYKISTVKGRNAKDVTTNLDNNHKLYPNPANTFLNIQWLAKDAHIKIYNAVGQVIIHKEVSGKETSVDVSVLKAGVYNIVIATDKGIIKDKFVKE